jgi:hypothetical protein
MLRLTDIKLTIYIVADNAFNVKNG